MPARGLTLSRRLRRPSPPAILLLSGPVLGAIALRPIPKQALTHVPLRDLALEAQYAEILEALTRYRQEEEQEAAAQDGQSKCRQCGTIAPEERVRCPCGNFLHAHRIFTCPDCSKVVPRQARDCVQCGAAFWSPVNPPEQALTDDMVHDYIEGLERSDFS